MADFNEFGEIIRGDNESPNLGDIPVFTPPSDPREIEAPKVEPVDPSVLKKTQEELFPETYGKDAKKIEIQDFSKTTPEVNKEQDL